MSTIGSHSAGWPATATIRAPRSHGHTRQRRGCQTCRTRKKKCNQSYPICDHCSRLNLVCDWEDPRRAKDAASDRAIKTSSQFLGTISDQALQLVDLTRLADPLLLLPSTDTTSGGSLASSCRAMMRYYTATFALMLTTNVENNCFLSVLLPMAFESPVLTHALAAFSSTHLALRNEVFRDVSLRHRGEVLTELKTAIAHNSMSQEMSLAVVMVLCSMEAIADPTNSWTHHLAGAAATLLPRGAHEVPEQLRLELQASFEGRWLLRNFAYHDILMSVSMDRRPFISGDYWLCNEDGTAVADTYFGFAGRILYLIGEISNLNADMKNAYGDSSETDEPPELSQQVTESIMSQRAQSIESELRGWSCPIVEAATGDGPLTLLSEAYRHAALIHLYGVLRRHVPSHAEFMHDKVLVSVSTICAAARAMPDGALTGCTMLFPLFMAGGEAEDATEIAIIRERLTTMNRWRYFGNFDKCINVLDEVWRLSSAGTHKEGAVRVGWLDIVKRRGWKLALT